MYEEETIMALPSNFETIYNATDYAGTLDQAFSFEVLNIGTDIPSTLIQPTQDWESHVEWTMTGNLVLNLQEEFRVTAFLEDMSPADLDVQNGPIAVSTFSAPVAAGPSRHYALDIPFAAGAVAPGVYEVMVLIQLFETAPSNSPWPVAVFGE